MIKFSKDFLKENMMGPNAVKILDELLEDITLTPNMKILDLGCGRGLSSIRLADKYKSTVFAFDLWISATDNYQRFKSFGFKNIVPIHGDALQTPFADEYFDALISIDSYHYYGRDTEVMDKYISGQVKKGGLIALAIPGLSYELHHNIPAEMLRSWTPEAISTLHSLAWWQELLSKSQTVEIISIKEMACTEDTWNDWLECTENQYAAGDVAAMAAGAGKYMTFIAIILKKK